MGLVSSFVPVYVNSLLEKFQNSGLGCHIGRLSMVAFMYADDLVLARIILKQER